MFYLKEFFKLLRENYIVGFLFVISTFAVVGISHNQSKISAMMSSAQKMSSTPYFNALISGKSNLVSVVRKMKSLPGVLSVSFQGEKELQKEVKSLKSTFGGHVLKNFSALQYKNMKIELESGIKIKSQNLIREYLGRLIGKSNVTMTGVKKPKLSTRKKTKNIVQSFLGWGEKYLLGVGVLFWLFCTYLFMKPLMSYSYIIEKFQRKNMVAPKIILTGVTLFLSLSIVINFYFNSKFTMTSFLVPGIMAGLAFLIVYIGQKTSKVIVK